MFIKPDHRSDKQLDSLGHDCMTAKRVLTNITADVLLSSLWTQHSWAEHKIRYVKGTAKCAFLVVKLIMLMN